VTTGASRSRGVVAVVHVGKMGTDIPVGHTVSSAAQLGAASSKTSQLLCPTCIGRPISTTPPAELDCCPSSRHLYCWRRPRMASGIVASYPHRTRVSDPVASKLMICPTSVLWHDKSATASAPVVVEDLRHSILQQALLGVRAPSAATASANGSVWDRWHTSL